MPRHNTAVGGGLTGSFIEQVAPESFITTPVSESSVTGFSVSGSWASDCRSVNRGAYYAWFYSFTIDSPIDVKIDLESETDTFLFLRRGESLFGEVIAFNNDTDEANRNSRLTEFLGPGTYTLEATTNRSGAIGSFNLYLATVRLGAGGVPCHDTITQSVTGSSVSGFWASDCRSVNRIGRFAWFYTFTVDAYTEVKIDLKSSAADSYLNLLSGGSSSGGIMASNNFFEAANPNAHLTEFLHPGTYTVEATTFAGTASGRFDLSLASDLIDVGGFPCHDTITQSVTGSSVMEFSVNRPWTSDCKSIHRRSGGPFSRYYTFSVDSPTYLKIDLESEIDTYLILWRGDSFSEEIVAQNDDIYPRTSNYNSRLTEVLDPGTYTVEATTYRARKTGSFKLSLGSTRVGAGGVRCHDPIRVGQSMSGFWASDCKTVNGRTDRSFAWFYTFSVDSPIDVEINLKSEIDTYLILSRVDDSSEEKIAINDDLAYRNYNSRISELLPQGTYKVGATTFEGRVTGSFDLSISRR